MAILEFIHCFVVVLDKQFGQVCELDIMNDPDVVRVSVWWQQLCVAASWLTCSWELQLSYQA